MFKVTVHKELKTPLSFKNDKFETPCVFWVDDSDKEKIEKYLTGRRKLKDSEYAIEESDVTPEMITDEELISSLSSL